MTSVERPASRQKVFLKFNDRIKELRRVPANSLIPSSHNWRKHPPEQRAALEGVLAEIGYADALICRELEDGQLEIIDGHLRADVSGKSLVPVLVLDVTAEEADKILLTLDPLASMAEKDGAMLTQLLQNVSFDSEAINRMLDALVTGGLQLIPMLGEELTESLADGIALCVCQECGHEHHRTEK